MAEAAKRQTGALYRYNAVDVLIIAFLAAFAALTLYPVLYVASVSISDPAAVLQNRVTVWPVGFNIKAYVELTKNSMLWLGYRNTIFITVVGTLLNVTLTLITAFPLSRSWFAYRNRFMFFIAFTMFFSGGMIPSFMVVQELGLINSLWALILPGAIGAYNVIVARTFFETIPASLEESVKLDGGGDFTVFTRIFLPLSQAMIAVIALFYAVGHWNAFFGAMLYIRESNLRPLQLILREIVLQFQTKEYVPEASLDNVDLARSVQYAAIMVSLIPMLVLYPFLQKYFVKGVMIGAIKG